MAAPALAITSPVMRPRIAITGLGAVTALGNGAAALDRGLRAARSGNTESTLFDLQGMRARIGGQAPEPDDALVAGLCSAPASRPDRFGLRAAAEAIAHAGIGPDELAGAACVFGTGTGGLALTERVVVERRAGGHPPSSLLVAHQACSVTDLVARRFAVGGPRTTIMTACSSSATAIGYAADLIRLGRAAVAIAGGAEGLCRLTWAGFGALRATSPEPCRPFDRDRKGLNLGEGAAVMVLESEEHARRRGASILGWFAGYGVTADAHHMTAPHPEGDGAARAMIAALADAGLPAGAVDYVNAHGTATPQNDAAEALALRRVFGDRAAPLPV
jgi:3-oxoacyl-[acyl-carrier-protein] synthase II